jgi:hypothetical protein
LPLSPTLRLLSYRSNRMKQLCCLHAFLLPPDHDVYCGDLVHYKSIRKIRIVPSDDHLDIRSLDLYFLCNLDDGGVGGTLRGKTNEIRCFSQNMFNPVILDLIPHVELIMPGG